MKNYRMSIVAVAIVFLFSCNKKEATTPYFLKAKIDDQWVNFSDAHFFVNPDASDPSVMDLQFYAGDYLNNLNIIIKTTQGIATGDFTTNATLPPYLMVMNLFKYNGQYIETYGSSTSSGSNQPSYTVTITSYNETEIKGTISGNYLYDAQDGLMTNLTQAEFVARKAN